LKHGTVIKRAPKQKLGLVITRMLDELKELENGEFEGYDEEHNWTHKRCILGIALCKYIDTTPQHRFDASRA
jgi:hypothetical protein